MVQIEDMWVTPGPQPNGLQATSDGLWVIDQTDNHLYKLSYTDGSVIEKLPTETVHSSGVTEGGGHLWVASTYSCELFKLDFHGGTAAKYDTPGKGVVSFAKDPSTAPVTGAHGMEWIDDDNMWVAVPPAQKVFLMDPKTMTVKREIPSPDARPHGLFMHAGSIWLADTGLGEIHRLDSETGVVLARIHRRTALGTALEEASGCSSESGIMVLEQKPARKQGAPNRCCHRTNPTVSASSLTTIAWWPMPACSCRPP